MKYSDEDNVVMLPKILDNRGNLSFVESGQHIPFAIKRVHWIYDVPGGEERGGVAYKETEEFVIALSGSFDVVIDDGQNVKRITLNRSYYGVYIPSRTWRFLDDFSTNSVAMIAASTHYNPADAIRDYNEFTAYVQSC